jgi:hypothetical protein
MDPLAVSFGSVNIKVRKLEVNESLMHKFLHCQLYLAWHCAFIGRGIKNWRSGTDYPIQVTSFLHHCANGLSSFVIPGDVLWIHLLLRQANQ